MNLEEYRSSPERYRGLRLPLWLSESPNAWLIIPLTSGTELLGFVILATARTRIDVNWEVNDLLKTAARQAATFLGQMQATEALLEARKFDAFNRMSAFVVHDLKNIVAQLSLMLKNAERHRDNPEFQKDMLMTVEHSVERMKQLMMQLREGTTPVDAPPRVDLVCRHRSHPAQQGKSGADSRVASRGKGDRARPRRPDRASHRPCRAERDRRDRQGRSRVDETRKNDGQAVVEVGDTGTGMSAEFVRDRLFKPFQTTKATGMGIGAYESFQYVQELGGRVQVDSTPGAGTRVRLLLPLFEVPGNTASDRTEGAGMNDKARPLLIVEDDPALQKQICWAFDQYETLPAARPRERAGTAPPARAARGHDGPRPAAGSRFASPKDSSFSSRSWSSRPTPR